MYSENKTLQNRPSCHYFRDLVKGKHKLCIYCSGSQSTQWFLPMKIENSFQSPESFCSVFS